jgi:hypothetical protein
MKTFNASDLVHSQAKREAQDLKGYQDILNESRRRFNELLGPLAEKLCELYDTSRQEEIKPTLSEILTEGSQRIDDAVEAVIAKHEEETAYIEAKSKAEKDLAMSSMDIYGLDSRHLGNLSLGQLQMAREYNPLYQQMGSAQRDAMNQAQVGSASLSAGGWI